jgi:hypothetical protein
MRDVVDLAAFQKRALEIPSAARRVGLGDEGAFAGSDQQLCFHRPNRRHILYMSGARGLRPAQKATAELAENAPFDKLRVNAHGELVEPCALGGCSNGGQI